MQRYIISYHSTVFNAFFCSAVECAAVRPPSHGSVSAEDRTYGNVAVFSCNPGFHMEGNSRRTCMADGRWSGAQPTCNRECLRDIVVKNLYIIIDTLMQKLSARH